jgi:hypothetical protein
MSMPIREEEVKPPVQREMKENSILMLRSYAGGVS